MFEPDVVVNDEFGERIAENRVISRPDTDGRVRSRAPSRAKAADAAFPAQYLRCAIRRYDGIHSVSLSHEC